MKNKIDIELKQAMRDKDANKLNVLRALKNEITNASLRKGSVNEVISDVEIIALIRKEISKRQDSINAFVSANRQDLILKENSEIEVLNQYLPAEMSDEELFAEVCDAITILGATGKKDMGRVIKTLQENLAGRADNKRISKIVGEQLS